MLEYSAKIEIQEPNSLKNEHVGHSYRPQIVKKKNLIGAEGEKAERGNENRLVGAVFIFQVDEVLGR